MPLPSHQLVQRYFAFVLSSTSLVALGCGRDEPERGLIYRAQIERNPNPTVPMAAIVHLQTNERTKVSIDIKGGSLPTHAEFSEFQAIHDIPVVGLVPGQTNTITINVESESKRKESTILSFNADPLPPDFPPITLTTSDPSAMEPGLTLFNVFQWDPFLIGVVNPSGWLIAVNQAGEVVWYHRPEAVPGDARQLPNGHFRYEYDQTGFVEIDLLGNDIKRWHATGLGLAPPPNAILVATDTMHHDLQELPDGHFISLSTAMIPAPSYPTSDKDPQAPLANTTVIVDRVNEFDPDGHITKEWFIDDFIDVYRIQYDSLSPFWDTLYREQATGTKDWSHANALAYSTQDDAIIVSLRNQDALVKFSRKDGSLVWILGPHAHWKSPWKEALLKPEPGLEWFYHQHAPKVFPDGRIILFDNGNFRASPPEPKVPGKDNHSRVVEFRVDESKRTVKQEWAYGGADTEIFYSPFLGDADLLEKSGNVLITDGGRVMDQQGRASDDIILGHKWARIFEITHDAKPRKVFELQIKSPVTVGFGGWSVYRAARIPSLYR